MKKVFIGVGHGGNDPGACGNGLREADLTLAIARHCRTALERCGVTVKLSREKDENDPVSQEANECNAFAPDCAVDIHINAGGGTGFEAWHTVGGGKGKALATAINNAIVRDGIKSRGLKTRASSTGKDYFAFIRIPRCPSIILEAGFIDSSDYKLFANNAGQKRFGELYAQGICTYLGITYVNAQTTEKQKAEEEKPMRIYNWFKEMPDWARSSAEKAYQKGIIKADQKTGAVQVYESNLQTIVWLDRLGMLDKEFPETAPPAVQNPSLATAL